MATGGALALPERAFLQCIMSARVLTYEEAARRYNGFVEQCGGDAVRPQLEVGRLGAHGESLERLVARLNRSIQEFNFVVHRGKGDDGARYVGICNASAEDQAGKLPTTYFSSEVALFRVLIFDKLLNEESEYYDEGSVPLMAAVNACRELDVGALRMTEAEAAIERLVADRWLARVRDAQGNARVAPGIRTYLEVREANAWKMKRAQSAIAAGDEARQGGEAAAAAAAAPR